MVVVLVGGSSSSFGGGGRGGEGCDDAPVIVFGFNSLRILLLLL